VAVVFKEMYMGINIYDDSLSMDWAIPRYANPDAETVFEYPHGIQAPEVPVVSGRFWKGVLFALIPSLFLWGLIIWAAIKLF
jgi:hypothetical protein